MKVCDTYEVRIYAGLQEGYDYGPIHDIEEVVDVCREYCEKNSLGATFGLRISPTNFAYNGGSEPGVEIGLINYPRFPSGISIIVQHAIDIAKLIVKTFNQQRVSVVFSDKTYLVEQE